MGLFDFLKKKQPNSTMVTQTPEEKAVEPQKIQKTFKPYIPQSPQNPDVTIPDRIGSCLRVYYYPKLKISPAPSAEDQAKNMQETGDWKLEPVEAESGVNLLYHGEVFALLLDKVDMVKDWLKRGDPMIAILSNLGDSGNLAAIAFYRDEEKRLASRNFDIVKLTRYANEDAQFNLAGLQPGDKLELEEDYEREDAVNVLYGAEIGALPKKYAKKYIDEGCAGVFLDHIDTDDNYKDVPYVKIYW